MLNHYDAVIWYSGNDLVTREPGWGPGNASRLANDMTLEMRQYLNEGGKLLYTGQWAGALENGVAGAQYYDPVANEQCVVGGELVLARCKLIADKNDFIQYYLGSYLYNSRRRDRRKRPAGPGRGRLRSVHGHRLGVQRRPRAPTTRSTPRPSSPPAAC